MILYVKVSEIKIPESIREVADYDIELLAADIKEKGLLTPPVFGYKNGLLYLDQGTRRILAMQKLGFEYTAIQIRIHIHI